MSAAPHATPARSNASPAGNRRARRLQRLGIFLLMAVVLAIMLFPFYWMILTSFRSQVDNTSAVPVWFFVPTLKNYINVIRQNDFLAYTWHSFVIAALSTAFGLLLGLPAAYSIARFKQNGLAFAILLARLTPYITYLVPWYLAFRALKLIDTYTALTPTHLIVGMPLIVWIMISFFEDVPKDLEEAAFVDGASRIGAFLRISSRSRRPGWCRRASCRSSSAGTSSCSAWCSRDRTRDRSRWRCSTSSPTVRSTSAVLGRPRC